jgi:UPF0042 nucleotide-binding protein
MTVPTRILLITGMSGAGKSTALKTLEDLGWETVDNLPLSLLERLLATPGDGAYDHNGRPLAIGIDSRTRAFDADAIVTRIRDLQNVDGLDVGVLFLDCAGSELERRFSETRRRHPLALDRPAADGIARERELLSPLRRAAAHVIDTTDSTVNDLRLGIRERFAEENASGIPTLTLMSFGFARGVPRNADLVFDMRFLDNPHWHDKLRPLTGLDSRVAAHISRDPAYGESLERIGGLIEFLLPRYAAEGKAYITIALGCTGGRHRSVHIAEQLGERLRGAGFSPIVVHMDMGASPDDMVEGQHPGEPSGADSQ